MVPVTFFKDPDIMALPNNDARLILLGLILLADDEGRLVAQADLLGRETDYPAGQIEVALQELVANDLLLLYQVGRHRYGQLTRWQDWQTLYKPKPSTLPAPPDHAPNSSAHNQQSSSQIEDRSCASPPSNFSKKEEELSASPPSNFSRKNEKNFEKENKILVEGEGKRKENEVEVEVEAVEKKVVNKIEKENTTNSAPQNIPDGHTASVGPTSHTAPCDDDDVFKEAQTDTAPAGSEEEMRALEREVACILKVPVDDQLARLVRNFAVVPGLSLAVEADAAYAWIRDPARNKQHKRMSVDFFRNWLKREQQALQLSYAPHQSVLTPGRTDGLSRSLDVSRLTPERSPDRQPSLMHLGAEDELRRAKGYTNSWNVYCQTIQTRSAVSSVA